MPDQPQADSSEETSFLVDYRAYVESTLEPLRLAVQGHLREWQSEGYWSHEAPEKGPIPFPIQRIRARVKRAESVTDKIRRKPESYPAGVSLQSARQMGDTVGGRVVVYFLGHLRLIDAEVRKSEVFELDPKEAPQAYLPRGTLHRIGLDDRRFDVSEKLSGYASLHYRLRLRSAHAVGENPWFELQVRTMAEELWSEIEHQLGYKPERLNDFVIKRQFQILGEHLAAIDGHFDLLYAQLAHDQAEVKIEPTSPLTTENLAAVLSTVELAVGQNEIGGLLKILASNQVRTAGDFQARASFQAMHLIREFYLDKEGRHPSGFEAVAVVAELPENATDRTVRQTVQRVYTAGQIWHQYLAQRGEAPRHRGSE